MSPKTRTLPFIASKILLFWAGTGIETSFAAGLPRFVMVTGACFDWTASITDAYLVLNSVTLMILLFLPLLP